MDQVTLLKNLIDYLIKEARKQSMSEDFQDGYEHAIYQIGLFGNFSPYPIHERIGKLSSDFFKKK